MTEARSVLVRKIVASIGSATTGTVLATNLLRAQYLHGAAFLLIASLCAVPVVVAGLVWSRRLTAQLLARGAWWSMLLIAGLGAFMSGSPQFLLMSMCNAVALLGMGRIGLDGGPGGFQPVAFRGTLLLALVLAIADTGAFLYCGLAVALEERNLQVASLAIPMAIGIVGLLRLRTWGLLVGVGTNVLVAVLAATRVLHLPIELRMLFIGTASLQLLVPVPMIASIVRRRAPDPEGWRRTKTVAVASVILGIVALSAYAVLLRGHPFYRYY